MVQKAQGYFKIGRGEGFRLAVIATLLFLLIAANNLIKILRDSVFLGHHSVTELPYLYVLVALIAGVVIAIYTRFTANLSMVRLILASNGLVIVAVAGFWVLFTYSDPGWSHYAFYIWSAMATVIAVAQLWTFAGQIFTADEGKYLFGLVAAGGTLGGVAAGFCAKWALDLSLETNHLLWAVGGLYLAASTLLCVTQRRLRLSSSLAEPTAFRSSAAVNGEPIFAHLFESPYLKIIATLIFVSVIVSTLIDFELKTAVKGTYQSKAALAGFFGSYYGWLSVATLFAQVILTGKTLAKLGLGASLYVTPVALMSGSLAVMIWPGLIAAALTRIADATLRNSIHRSSMEILYMDVPGRVRKSIKAFLDVVVERIGDASAGLIILAVSMSSMVRYRTYVHFICVGLILSWIALIRVLQSGYAEVLPRGALPDEPSPSLVSKATAGE